MRRSFGNGKGGGFRQPRFDDQYQRRNSVGRGSHMAATAWQSRDSYLRDLDRDRDGGFGTFRSSGAGYQNQQEPSMTAPVTAEETNSPARETNKEKRWNMYENGHNRPTSRHEIETWSEAQWR